MRTCGPSARWPELLPALVQREPMFTGNLVQYFNQQFIKKTIQLSSSQPSKWQTKQLSVYQVSLYWRLVRAVTCSWSTLRRPRQGSRSAHRTPPVKKNVFYRHTQIICLLPTPLFRAMLGGKNVLFQGRCSLTIGIEIAKEKCKT